MSEIFLDIEPSGLQRVGIIGLELDFRWLNRYVVGFSPSSCCLRELRVFLLWMSVVLIKESYSVAMRTLILSVSDDGFWRRLFRAWWWRIVAFRIFAFL